MTNVRTANAPMTVKATIAKKSTNDPFKPITRAKELSNNGKISTAATNAFSV